MADAGVDFDAYVDVRFHWHKRLMLVLCACVASENQAFEKIHERLYIPNLHQSNHVITSLLITDMNKYRESLLDFRNRPSSIYQYSGMATRLYGQISRFISVFFVSQVSMAISGQNNIQILTLKSRSHVRKLIY